MIWNEEVPYKWETEQEEGTTASPQSLCCGSRENLGFQVGHTTISPRAIILMEIAPFQLSVLSFSRMCKFLIMLLWLMLISLALKNNAKYKENIEYVFVQWCFLKWLSHYLFGLVSNFLGYRIDDTLPQRQMWKLLKGQKKTSYIPGRNPSNSEHNKTLSK